jgi:outer membrane protein TolC
MQWSRRRWISRAAACCLVILFAGCTPFANYPSPPSLPDSLARSVSSISSATPSAELVLLPLDDKQLVISFDTVLRSTEDQNGQINLARERIRQASAERELAQKGWLPDLYAGIGYYRHEGGIQNEDGRLTHSSFGSLFGGLEVGGRLDLRDLAFQKLDSERRLWQRKGELSKLTSENLLDAAVTYIDLLSALTSERIGRSLLQDLQELLDTAQRIAKVEPTNQAEVSRIRTEISAQRQQQRKAKEQATAASAKLAYLLGVAPDA